MAINPPLSPETFGNDRLLSEIPFQLIRDEISSDNQPLVVNDLSNTLEMLGTEFDPSVIEEAADLERNGTDVSIVESPDIAEFESIDRRKQIISVATSLMVKAAGIYDPNKEKTSLLYRIPTAKRWYGKSGTALAINAGVLTRRSLTGEQRKSSVFCEGIDPEIFTKPIFKPLIDGENHTFIISDNKDTSVENAALTPQDILRAQGKSNAEITQTTQEHQAYVNGKVGPVGRLFLDGLADMEGIRTRISLGVSMIREAVKDHPKEKPLVLASLGAGSALPVIETIRELTKDGYQIGRYHLVDADPMALAAAVSALRNSGIENVEDIIRIHIGDLGRKGTGIDGIENGTVDVADALGLYEYLRDKFADRFAKSCKAILKDNGSLCITNMHPARAQNSFFKDLIRWEPAVQQRDLTSVVNGLTKSGFGKVSIRLGHKGSLYPGYIAKKPSV